MARSDQLVDLETEIYFPAIPNEKVNYSTDYPAASGNDLRSGATSRMRYFHMRTNQIAITSTVMTIAFAPNST